jgi:hypothetical protein
MLDQKRECGKNKFKVFQIIMQQCSSAIRVTVEGSPEHIKLEENDDIIGLLKVIEQFAFSTELVQYEFWTQQASQRMLLTMQQQAKGSLASYGRRYLARVEVTKELCG